MSEASVILAAQLGAWEVAVEFAPLGDRQAHRIVLQQDGQAQLWLESQEGDGSMNWPPSPPLQQLSLENQNGRDVALLVGMAGRSHWSLSVEALEDEIRFDAACRAHESPDWIGSRYAIRHPAAGLAVHADTGTRVVTADDELRIQPEAVAGSLIRWVYRVALCDG